MVLKFIIITINIFTVVLAFFINIDSAYAEMNCFSPDTQIAIPKSNLSIDKVHSGDLVIGYNFDNEKEVVFTVKSIVKDTNFGYFLINDDVKIPGTNFVYLNSIKPKIVKVHLLQDHRFVSGRNSKDIEINNINHITVV